MMSTMGRMPVIAAPTAMPVKPGSEIGVSSTRSVPNSSTSPVRTLNTVPASAMSSPHMNTRESRRISSAIASRTASANVNSLVSGINVLINLIWRWIWSCDRELNRFLDFCFHFGLDLIELSAVGEIVGDHPIAEHLDRIALRLPRLLFLLRAVVLTIDVADMVPHESIRLAHQECGTRPGSRALHDRLRRVVDGANVLPIDALGRYAEGGRACQHVARDRFRIVCVFVVEVVFANVDDRELPERSHVHHFVQQALSERA